MTQATSTLAAPGTIRGATVTTEDGGRLNAFATEPRMEVVDVQSSWGFHERAEKLNGRMAMLGFIALLAELTGAAVWSSDRPLGEGQIWRLRQQIGVQAPRAEMRQQPQGVGVGETAERAGAVDDERLGEGVAGAQSEECCERDCGYHIGFPRSYFSTVDFLATGRAYR